MGNVNIKLYGSENLIIKKPSDEAAAQAVEEIVDAAVEKALAEATGPKQEDRVASSQQNETTIKIDSMQIIADINRAALPGTQNNRSNKVSGIVPKEEANMAIKKAERSGSGSYSFEDLVQQWYQLDFDNATYDEKDALMVSIIQAAEDMAASLGENDPNYQEWIDKANTWRCYRVIMRNNYQQQLYFELRQRLLSGESFESVFSNVGHDNPNWVTEILMRLQHDASREYWSEDEEDFRTTNPIYAADGYTILGYTYDNQGFQYFGGQTVKVGDGPPPKYIYVQNDDPQQRFLYNEAMIAMYTTKILAAQIRLKDPDIINNENQSFKEQLERNVAEYRRLIQRFVQERKTLAIQLGLMGIDYQWYEGNDGLYNDLYHGLVPGLTPPTNNSQTGNEPNNNPTDMPGAYAALQEEYNHTHNQLSQPELEAMLNKLIWYANQLGLPGEAAQWQSLLEQIGGRGTTTIPGGGKSNIAATSKITPDAVQTPNSRKVTTFVNPSNISPAEGTDGVIAPEVNLNGDFATLVTNWNNFIAGLTTDEPAAYNAKIAMLDAIINAAIAEEKGEETINIWRCRRFILIQNYAAMLMQDYQEQLLNGNVTYTDWPFGNVELHIYGQVFDTTGTAFLSDISLTDFWHSSFAGNTSINNICDAGDCEAVNAFRGKLKLTGGVGPYQHGPGYLPNENPELEYYYSKALIAYYRAQISAIHAKLAGVGVTPGMSLDEYPNDLARQLFHWACHAQEEIRKCYNIISTYCRDYCIENGIDMSEWEVPGLTPVAPTQPAPPTFEEILAEGGEALQEFYQQTVDKYNSIIGTGSATTDTLRELLTMLYEAARRLGNVEDANRWQQALLELDGGN